MTSARMTEAETAEHERKRAEKKKRFEERLAALVKVFRDDGAYEGDIIEVLVAETARARKDFGNSPD